MREFVIRLSSVQDVQAFVALATTRPFSVSVDDGRRQVNGKSFMEMFCLNFSRPLTISAQCSQEEFDLLRTDASAFLAEQS